MALSGARISPARRNAAPLLTTVTVSGTHRLEQSLAQQVERERTSA
jgi:hypothetical protein